jgi:hypothetical protein
MGSAAHQTSKNLGLNSALPQGAVVESGQLPVSETP